MYFNTTPRWVKGPSQNQILQIFKRRYKNHKKKEYKTDKTLLGHEKPRITNASRHAEHLQTPSSSTHPVVCQQQLGFKAASIDSGLQMNLAAAQSLATTCIMHEVLSERRV